MRLSIVHAATDRVSGAAFQLVKINDDRPVRIAHVLCGARFVVAFLQLLERITLGNFSILGFAPGRTPAAALDPVLHCRIKRRAIHSSLSAGDNFHVFVIPTEVEESLTISVFGK